MVTWAAPRLEVKVMDVFAMFDALWRHFPAVGLVLLGVGLVWRGLRGGPNGDRGLLHRRAGALGRIEGFRLAVVGLALVGIGAAWIWQAPWLLFLALGIGFVEGLESSAIIAAMRRGGGRAGLSVTPPAGRRG